jgi:hypothetical protein
MVICRAVCKVSRRVVCLQQKEAQAALITINNSINKYILCRMQNSSM